ncbi:death-associated inhibitor of apoptosis 1-like isoform X1 [Mya arenaria]|uniref:death-associated inhibitor of apoptosis 1-like isoform X1 n=2 Tax=Mya arenaria TaxID=6604 RepID=UPI0022E21D05|nr:death-associated inhibitor of apoptosis 1-like isoform X1 [Mya arenaria]XP_052808827.1 death-associated inhibitor of apoptosis 1-like isoform X1 [Mya arenaria]XP_052808828.1 death-associated inhibitor of apoptosis 1-like isoform X1 [Mya arenaria]
MQNRHISQRVLSMQDFGRTRYWFNVTEWARSGFFKHAHGALRCFCCNNIICPTPGDDPWMSHATFARFPHCMNVIAEKGIDFINRAYSMENNGVWAPSIVQRGAIAVTANIRERRFEPGREVQIYEDNPQGVQRFLTPTLLYDLKDTYRGRITDFRTLTGIQYRDPMEAHLLSAEARNHTFGNIQGDIEMPTSQNMAEAGFIYIGGRICRCYYCGIAISDWYVNDDPWERHARFNNGCYHVILSKGENYIRDVFANG